MASSRPATVAGAIVIILLVAGSSCFPLRNAAPLPLPTHAPTAAPISASAPAVLLEPPATPTISPTSTSAPTYTPSLRARPLITATVVLSDLLDALPTSNPAVTPWPPPTRLLSPGDPRPDLATHRLVTYYGSPPGPSLGVLGAGPRHVILEQLRTVTAQYQTLSPDHYVLPAFHIVVTIADPYAGEDGDYNHRIETAILEEWLAAAQREQVAVILDIQPGSADALSELARIRHYLYRPDVHLALDPEFAMEQNAVPGRSLGRLRSETINSVQAELDEIALTIGLNKILIIHQFDSLMVVNKEGIRDYPHVELVFDADGFGSPGAKTGDYLQYAQEPGFEYGGFKLFYNWDWPLMTPSEVMALDPAPAIIVYQ